MSSLQIFPYVCIDGKWSISDSVLAAIWLQMEMEGKVEHLFYDGSVTDVTGWLNHLKKDGIYPAIVADVEKAIPVHICWLNDISDGLAWAHHCSLGNYRRGAWEKVLEHWSLFNLRILLGLTPETNEKAIKFLKKICKFIVVGTIPQICNMVYEGHRVGGVISYYLMVSEEKEQWESASVVRVAAAR